MNRSSPDNSQVRWNVVHSNNSSKRGHLKDIGKQIWWNGDLGRLKHGIAAAAQGSTKAQVASIGVHVTLM
jgi:hypothetical protein